MATDKPMVSVYLPSELKARIDLFQSDQNIKSGSSAVVAALLDYFGMVENPSAYAPLDRVEALEGKLIA